MITGPPDDRDRVRDAVAELVELLGLPDRTPSDITYARFLAAVLRTLVDPDAREWRVGQTFFNVLAAYRSDLADGVRGSDLDPFHHNDRMPAFLHWVRNNWDVPQPDDQSHNQGRTP